MHLYLICIYGPWPSHCTVESEGAKCVIARGCADMRAVEFEAAKYNHPSYFTIVPSVIKSFLVAPFRPPC